MKNLKDTITEVITEAKTTRDGAIESDTTGFATKVYVYEDSFSDNTPVATRIELHGVKMSQYDYSVQSSAAAGRTFKELMDLYKSDKSKFDKYEAESKKERKELEKSMSNALLKATQAFDKVMISELKKINASIQNKINF
jgi:hypothetical protein